MIPIPLLVFHLVQAFGTAKGFVNLITKQNVPFSISRNFHAPMNLIKQYGCFKLVHFSKNRVVCSISGS